MGEATGPVVVGVDGSVFSRAALRWAISQGQRWSAPVIAVLVWHSVPHGTVCAVGCRQLLDRTVRDARAGLDAPMPLTRLATGVPAAVLVEQSRDARLLALGSHGHGWLRGSAMGSVIGSVAEYCVRRAACPVLLIPSGSVPVNPEPASEPVPAALLPDRYGLGPI